VRRLVFALVLGIALYVANEIRTWPDVGGLARRNPKSTAFIDLYRREAREVGRSDGVSWRWVPYAAIAPSLRRAVLVGEDIGFFSHNGFDLHEMKEAIAQAARDHEPPRGASTITQQVAKNLWLSPSRNPLRKVKEAILTWQLERTLDKKRILEIYLDVAEFGDGIYGAQAAAQAYFGKPASDFDEDEAARLAACLPNPHAWHPGAGSAVAERRAKRIRERMKRAEFLRKEI